mgnify:FL=1
MKTKGMLLVVSGPSGAGKGTICDALRCRFPHMDYSVSMTTRTPREGEKDGVNYFFTDNDSFEKLLEKDAFLEYAKVYDHYYGTPKDYVFNRMDEGHHVMLEIDIQGAMQIKKAYPDAVCIYVVPPSLEILSRRLRNRRTDSDEVIQKRLDKARTELDWIDKYDYLIVNDDLETAVSKAKAVITAEACRSRRNSVIIENLKKMYTL